MATAIGLVGKKCGMTHTVTPEDPFIPVTVIEVQPNRVVQIKTPQIEGYAAVQVTIGTKKRSKLTKPQEGHFAKAGVEPGEGLWEFRVETIETLAEIAIGSELTLAQFVEVKMVDVVGITKGCGFAGTHKRHHFALQDASHGNSLSHRVPGSIGQRQSPGKVFKGKKMPGHLGNVRRTIQNLKIIRIDLERHLVLIRGSVPGAENSYLFILPAVKADA